MEREGEGEKKKKEKERQKSKNHSNSLLQPQSVLTTCTVGQRATTRHSLHAFPDVVHGQPYLPAKSGLTNFSAHLTGLTF